jgi:hypothetical protein
MSTYPVDIKTSNITTADTHTVFNGPARVLGLSWVQPYNVAAGTITVKDDSSSVWVVDVPRTNDSDAGDSKSVAGSIMLPGTGIKVSTSLKVTNAVTTHVTVYYG